MSAASTAPEGTTPTEPTPPNGGIRTGRNLFAAIWVGVLIRVVFPELTEERRREYIKTARSKAEDARVSIRNVRRHAKDALDKMAKNSEAGEDDVHRAERELQDVTDTYVAKIDELLKHKEAELLEI